MKKWLLLLVFIPFFSFASYEDSLKKYELLFEEVTHLDSAVYYCEKSIIILENLNDLVALEKKYSDIASLYIELAELDNAKLYLNKAISICEEENLKEALGIKYAWLADVLSREEQYESAINYSLLSYHILDSLESPKILSTLKGIVFIYAEVNELEKAKSYANKVQEFIENTVLDNREDSLNYLQGYSELGAFYFTIKEFEHSKGLLLRSYAYAKALHDELGITQSAMFLSNIYTVQKNEDSLIHYINEAKYYGEKLGLKRQLIALETNYAALLISKKKYPEAIKRLYKVKQLSIDMGNNLKTEYRNLMTAYMRVNPDSAFYYFKKYDSASVSRLNEVKIKSITDLEIKYEIELKESENIWLKKDLEINKQRLKVRTYLMGGIVLFLLFTFVIGYLVYRRKKELSETNLLKLEQKLLRTQMSPHFIFNSLSAIGSFIRENKKEDSYRYLTKFGKLMRAILESSREEFISLEEEIEIIENFLFLHKLRLKEKLNYEINIDENIDVDEFDVPPMMLQPFIENAIEHGVEKQDKSSKIIVNIKLQNGDLILEVEDEGKGMEGVLKKDSTLGYKSYAIQITKERIHNLKRKRLIELTIKNVTTNDITSGTKVVLLINS